MAGSLSRPAVGVSRPLFYRGDQLLSDGNLDPVAARAAQDWPRNRVQLQRIAMFEIFLHGAAHVPRHGLYSREDRLCINLGTFRCGNGAGFPHTSLPQTEPLRVSKNLADSFID